VPGTVGAEPDAALEVGKEDRSTGAVDMIIDFTAFELPRLLAPSTVLPSMKIAAIDDEEAALGNRSRYLAVGSAAVGVVGVRAWRRARRCARLGGRPKGSSTRSCRRSRPQAPARPTASRQGMMRRPVERQSPITDVDYPDPTGSAVPLAVVLRRRRSVREFAA
jgi:hypothetical protein